MLPSFNDTNSLLRYLYADLTRIRQVASDDIVLHPADRSLRHGPGGEESAAIRGIEKVQAHEEALVAATGGTLVMEIDRITAKEHFGAAFGTLRAKSGARGPAHHHDGTIADDLAMPFCGLWKFVDGKAVEHWENAADPARLKEWLAGNLKQAASVCHSPPADNTAIN